MKYEFHTGIVKDIEDPEKRGRIRCKIPTLIEMSDWIPGLFPHCGSGEGFMMLPEKESQVLILVLMETDSDLQPGESFINAGWMRWIGGQYSKKQKSGFDHVIQGFSKKGMKFQFDLGNDCITISGKFGSIKIDKDNQIRIDHQKKLSFSVPDSGKIEITTSKVEVEHSSVEISGNVELGIGVKEPTIKGMTFQGIYNAHTHTVIKLGEPTSPPIVPLTGAEQSLSVKVGQ